MEPETVYYNKTQYITTKFGNKISKKSVLCGSDKICVRGKTIIESGSVIRGDLAAVNIGQSCILGEGSVIRSAEQKFKGGVVFLPVVIGDHCIIEKDSIVQAAQVGSFVHVGKSCNVSKRCVLSNCSKLLDNTVLAPGTVVPPFAVYGGNPGVAVGHLPESFQTTIIGLTNSYYKHFQPQPAA